VLYIGRATALRSRVGSYWSGLRGREHLKAMVQAIAAVEAVACACVHEAAWLEWFGPYLGGLRTRLAVRGLRRLLPLEQGAHGTAAELARTRGVAAIDPEARSRRIAAVLRREAGAVCWCGSASGPDA
jgi:excinuclease ABC subunit C